ncbi:hypothetical protein B0A50_03685 [Salinomyces thailandicus]|uniref:ATPase AAA-type core domain-containing protein n=1 Tax=Salinomyces thailandicus TaxID=706561 RepID=A0A4U0U4U5_9PEZI|nr:hypothetical protein B0A50_03685 [Salinomyces thailandica]
MTGDGETIVSVHPFFRKTDAEHESTAAAELSAAGSTAQSGDAIHDEDEKPAKGRKKRKSLGPSQPATKGKKQKTLSEVVAPTPVPGYNVAAEVPNATDNVQPSSNPVGQPPRRKRGKHATRGVIDVSSDAPAAQEMNEAAPPGSPRVIIPASPPLLARAPLDDTPPAAALTPPKKVLRLNASGKFSSPISKKAKEENDQQASPAAPKRRARPRKTKQAAEAKQLLVRIAYGKMADKTGHIALGDRIDRVIAGKERIEVGTRLATPKKATLKKLRTPRKSNKPTHPFFLGKPKDEPPKQQSPRKASATTPGKLRRQVFGERAPPVPEVPYAVGSALLKDRLMVKHPGARDPPWPDKEQTHVRGLEDEELPRFERVEQRSGSAKRRKGKAARLPFPPEESILHHVSIHLQPEPESMERDDGFREPHPSLRLPKKLLVSGYEIQQRIAPELSVSTYDEIGDDSCPPTSSQLGSHPALQKLWRKIISTTTASDEGKGESQSWAQKYAPTAAVEVLQPSREMGVIEDWLTSLTISAVESTLAQPAKLAPKQDPKQEPKPKKKKRRKPDDLNDFLVDSDEDIRNMDELTEPEDSKLVAGSKLQKSMVQTAVEGTKLSNAILFSGPRGCGKTAAAFAVATELGFRVFDISPNERRSGRDVIDKVGDMTENHLVKHHGVDPNELSASEEPNKKRLDEAFNRDLASGRQGKMNAFFEPNATTKPATPKQKASAKAKTFEAVQKALRKPSKDQQQSLILLEEVDILFKDDKDFWNTVFKLIVSSKRPFIMTCNNEDLVPLQAMSLHAILRFTSPPLDLATDYLLLLAAAEGHLLRRTAIDSLLRAKDQDLRASIAELNFWCQMGIGDPRGGLTWIYQRWPPGSDMDQYGRKLRVASDCTYPKGMGLTPDRGLCNEDRVMWTWREHGIDPFDLPNRTLQSRNGAHNAAPSRGRTDALRALKDFDSFVEARSSLDVYTRPGLPTSAPLDTTQPPVPDRSRHQYVEGLALLQADEAVDYSGLSMALSTRVALLLSDIARHEGSELNQLHRLAPDAGKLSSTILRGEHSNHVQHLTRSDFACFDPISSAPENILSFASGLAQSIFDGPLPPLATDLAPYVRSIVQYDLALEEQRERLNGLLAEADTRKTKRARTTRAARSALEGSKRADTRRERWFTKTLDLRAVLATGGPQWPKSSVPLAESAEGYASDVPPASSAETT